MKIHFCIPMHGFTADEIREIRHHLKITQDDLAEILGVSVDAVGKWEQNEGVRKGPAVRMLQIIKEAGVPEPILKRAR